MSVEELLQIDPGVLVIGANVRTDTRRDAREFAASIRARGVLEPVTAYRDEAGALVVVRGQRRAVVATQVGTPSGTVPVRVLPAPSEADRIVDQLTENLHRAGMHDQELRDGIEQLALTGVSAAQIAKRAALKRSTVDAALTVAASPLARDRMDVDNLTLDQAALFAEFADDEFALNALADAVRARRPLDHLAQRLRDEAAEARALSGEVERRRAQGLPVLDPAEAPRDLWRYRLADLRTTDGESVPCAEWPDVPGAAVVLTNDWLGGDLDEPDDHTDPDATDQEPTRGVDDEASDVDGTASRVSFRTVWICTDPAAAGLHHRYDRPRPGASATASDGSSSSSSEPDSTVVEAQRELRRTVLANNRAWRSAQTVRREWLAAFLLRKTPPAGAEQLICHAVLTGHHTLTRSMQDGHSLLCHLANADIPAGYGAHRAASQALARRAVTPKAAIMLTLGAVLAAWEASTDIHTWRRPTAWDARIMQSITAWGYQPSDVEALLTDEDADPDAPDVADDDTDSQSTQPDAGNQADAVPADHQANETA